MQWSDYLMLQFQIQSSQHNLPLPDRATTYTVVSLRTYSVPLHCLIQALFKVPKFKFHKHHACRSLNG